jgi:arylsulfatase
MCSTTRAALLTGRNHHSVGVGCLANFDSGYPGYRGKIARQAGTLAEMLCGHMLTAIIWSANGTSHR